MDNKREIEQKNLQEKDDNNTENVQKEEETKDPAQEENIGKPEDKKSQKEEIENNKQLEEEKSNNDNQINERITQRNEVINQFLAQMEDKSSKGDKSSSNKNRNKEEESEDPFLKAENEYRKNNCEKQNNEDAEEKKQKNEKKYSQNLRYQTKAEKENKKPFGINKKLIDKKLTINMIYNHFKNNSKTRKTEVKYKFKPLIYKNPELLYLKAIQDSELNHIKMKSYNRRTGMFDLELYKLKKNDYLKNSDYFFKTQTSFNNNNYKNCISTSSENRILSYMKYNNENNTINNNYNKLSKINMYQNDEKIKTIEEVLSNDDKDNNLFYTSISVHSHLTDKNQIMNNKNKIENKEYILSNNLQEEKIDTKSENIIKRNKNRKVSDYKKDNYKAYSANTNRIFISQNYRNNKTLSSKTTKNKNNSKYLMDKLLYSMNDPSNPYSINFSRKLLKNMFKKDIKYNKFELGVPLLSIKNSRKRKRLKLSEKPKEKERMVKTSYNKYPKYPSGFKTYYSNKNININKGNKRYFTMSNTGNNFYRK